MTKPTQAIKDTTPAESDAPLAAGVAVPGEETSHLNCVVCLSVPVDQRLETHHLQNHRVRGAPSVEARIREYVAKHWTPGNPLLVGARVAEAVGITRKHFSVVVYRNRHNGRPIEGLRTYARQEEAK